MPNKSKEGNRDQQRWSMSPELSRLNNEASRIKAIRAFMDRRKNENETNNYLLISNPDKDFNYKTFVKKINESKNVKDINSVIPGVPHVKFSDFFEVGWVAGTEDRYLEYVYAEWDNTKVSIKKHTHPECEKAIKADLAVLTEIRHPNVVLLIATSFVEGHGLVSIFESLNCTIYNYIHEKEERVSVQETVRCIRKLAEALGYAHMRGYIHGAISSHCVFLTSGIIKLGGWELATKKNEPKEEQEFENPLRAEIFRWQAPELFYDQTPTEATDIYGLSLLIWEMTTMQLPWNGLIKADIEKQYVHWKQGIPIDLYNFPSLLSKLLETGLEIDVAKRTISMNHMYKMLQRLELQYESEAPIYADQLAMNNNTPNTKTLNLPLGTAPPVKKCSSSRSSTSSDNWKSITKPSAIAAQNNLNKKLRSSSKRNSVINESEKIEEAVDNDSVYNIKKCTDLFLQMERLHTCIETQEDLWVLYNYYDQQKENSDIQSSIPSIINESEKSNFTSEERISSIIYGSTSSRTIESSDDDFNETRNDIKKLKESLASKRERFFYGDDCQRSISNTSTENKIPAYNNVQGKSYEPHKPASHKTSFEPKLHKTSQPELILTKPIKEKEQTFEHSCISSIIKDAVINPQLVNANHDNVFESSLWRKEKMIVMSKMRKSFTDDTVTYSQDLKREISQNDERNLKSMENDTFNMNSLIIDNDACLNERFIEEKSLDESDKKVIDVIDNSELNINNEFSDNHQESENKSLIALKQALDRATEIICPADNSLRFSSHKTVDEMTNEKSISNDKEKENNDNLSLLLFTDKMNDECNSCHHTAALARRRSLPAALGQSKVFTKMPVGKLSTLMADPSDTTFEDLYIDDDFGESLNVNMVLLANENLLDQDILPDLLELSHNSLFNR
ncbi:probable tyrosine-protein kinase DDB_G0283397 isoform X2 [Leptopilina heterotoma]|uniref:probable tyrosine-protein kinase DDB_G0283397 isoform X2 n=1 Tax=Leptopilina heterotoma TaxID=63436 RepID=UPI001CA84109|nr:probable tyrosine-protein kinase DDB_G0283397 isoform X2 [Leptopilina heterotoma]